MRVNVHKPGWAQPVGWGCAKPEPELVEGQDFVGLRVELRDFHLSHAAALYLLQGASLKQLFADVVVKVGDRDPDVYSLAIADPVRLVDPPPRVRRVVLSHILERSAHVAPDVLFERLFLMELARSSF